ncbi:hypothetical protein [Candidatus Methanosphaera massiliense]|uniref:hypothetical protein n=1 Tax=Methanosphaera TaxID=2316 RepID=UPI000DC572E5|nr:hypothetical protein [Candidatus Methanosphaera massiliense]MDD6285182.1 hypothetical protein [Methanobacteriaceae archaeon]MDE4078455.1 hypothetical protein [Candidatus Methanosphaera massiliense]MDY2744588.1 hypothetical protein [Methanosphaera sp.]RAP45475.1 MAG: hypothetical protein BZ134_01065 [Methanosphaera sp. SHI1033]
MTDNVDRLGTRMVELNNALQDKRTNPDFAFEDINSVDMLVKIIVNLESNEKGIEDGIYIYINEEGDIVNAEYFVKEHGEITIFSFDDAQLDLIRELFGDVFAVNVE